MRTMKISVLLTCALLLGAANVANATAFTSDFESGNNGWSIVNGTETNKWVRGNGKSCSGSYSLYVSSSGSTYKYDEDTPSLVHFYRAIDKVKGRLSFSAVGTGERRYDYVRVCVASSIPSAGNSTNGTYYGENYCGYSTCARITINIPAGDGTRYLIFTWRSDNSAGGQPVAIDNITYTSPTDSKSSISITGATIAAKTYNGATTATVTGVTFSGLVSGTPLELDTDYTATATFDNATIGSGKTVTVTVTLKNTDKANAYFLSCDTYTLTGQSIERNSISIDSAFVSLENHSATGSATVDSVWFEGLLAGDRLTRDIDYTVDSAVISGCIRAGYGTEIKLYISLIDDGSTAKYYTLKSGSSPYIFYDRSSLIESTKRVIFVVGMDSWPLSDVLAFLVNEELKRDNSYSSYEDVTRSSAVQRQVKALRRCEIAKNSACLSRYNLLKWSITQGVAQVCLIQAQGDGKGGYTFSAELFSEQGLRTASCTAVGTSAAQLTKAAWDLAGLLRKSASTPEVCCEP